MEEDGNGSVGSLTSEQWELCIENIPYDLQLQYAPFVASLSFTIRIHLYQILDLFNYSEEYCIIVLDVMKYVGNNCNNFIEYGHTLHISRLPLYFYICRSINEPHLTEFLSNTSYEILNQLIDIAYYIPESDVKVMIHLIHDLSVHEFYSLVTLSNECLAKHCRLCRSKRNYQLEYRLLNGQINNEIHGTLPGIVPLYDKAEIWQADNDSKFYTFNYERGIVLWRKDVVDLIKICDKCLVEVHAASSEVTRFDPYHHEEGMVKKHHLEEMRKLEQARAHLIGQIAIERVRRRVKEWSIRALKCQREGHLREEKERKRVEEQQRQEEIQQKYHQSKNDLLRKALSTDKFWVQHEKNSQSIRNQYKSDLFELKTYPKFSRDNPMKPIREHPHSWRLAPFGGVDGNMPLEKDAASKRFGTGDVAPDIRTAELTMWKNQAQYLHKNYLEKLELQRQEEKEKRRLEAIEINLYLQEKFYQSGKAERMRRNEMEQAEEDRIMRRKLEREERKRIRIAKGEERERFLMCTEDRLSFRKRYFDQESITQARECQEMHQAELEQTKIDAFWGIPTAIRNAKNAQASELLSWKGTCDEYRKMCIQVRIIRPYPSEYGLYRDRFTGKKIK